MCLSFINSRNDSERHQRKHQLSKQYYDYTLYCHIYNIENDTYKKYICKR